MRDWAEVQGLAPDRWYFYRFIAGGVSSPVGRTRTLPAADAAVNRLRVAYASCQRWEHGYYAAYRHMRAEDVDLVLFLGDYIYEYPNATAAVRNFPTLATVITLADYRDRHAMHRSDPQLQAMHAACPWILTWDDHEVQNDYAGLLPGTGGPMDVGGAPDFLARRNAAYQAYYEHMPLRASAFVRAMSPGVSHEVRLYEQYRWGRLADILMLDSRQFRDGQVCGSPQHRSSLVDPATCEALMDPARTYLGAGQERWLDGALARETGEEAGLALPQLRDLQLGGWVRTERPHATTPGGYVVERLACSLRQHAAASLPLWCAIMHTVVHVKLRAGRHWQRQNKAHLRSDCQRHIAQKPVQRSGCDDGEVHQSDGVD